MTWLQQLAGELSGRGVSGEDRARILDELRDHIGCEPGCEQRLGDPRALATRFADELAGSLARRSAFVAFGALAGAAAVLAISQLTIGHAGGPPGFNHGHSVALFLPAAIGMLIAPQVALVAGTLAAWRALRRRDAASLSAAEVSLIRRRTRVALAAGWATLAGLALYVVDFTALLPVWWLTLVGGLTAIAAIGIAAASRELAHSGELVSSSAGRAGDLFDDLPPVGRDWLRRHPWRLGGLVSVLVGLAMTAFEAHAEHSLPEGLQRGVAEGLAAAAGFLLLGRAIGARSGTADDVDRHPA